MSSSTALPEAIETMPGKVMPEVLKELDFEISGALVTPATMDNNTTVTLSSSCTGRPQQPTRP
ncbi:glycerol-3-phosphate responsive antiterminator [Psychromicrobium silvestre]|uniref:Glycerol-3-phosphate responsive antiterminator n=1 Tax=Psychromicrobium silvestre TaxID=1645614 RepID=A0A7Y9LTQ3_9MICC|nr:hypothetical protein [Psychromicrobium silvestre]NYE95340.1 glycerol-3-phosphate responsive antiterminator [Psychromicrobium silvestre]